MRGYRKCISRMRTAFWRFEATEKVGCVTPHGDKCARDEAVSLSKKEIASTIMLSRNDKSWVSFSLSSVSRCGGTTKKVSRIDGDRRTTLRSVLDDG